jgi:hypothetical protein
MVWNPRTIETLLINNESSTIAWANRGKEEAVDFAHGRVAPLRHYIARGEDHQAVEEMAARAMSPGWADSPRSAARRSTRRALSSAAIVALAPTSKANRVDPTAPTCASSRPFATGFVTHADARQSSVVSQCETSQLVNRTSPTSRASLSK